MLDLELGHELSCFYQPGEHPLRLRACSDLLYKITCLSGNWDDARSCEIAWIPHIDDERGIARINRCFSFNCIKHCGIRLPANSITKFFAISISFVVCDFSESETYPIVSIG